MPLTEQQIERLQRRLATEASTSRRRINLLFRAEISAQREDVQQAVTERLVELAAADEGGRAWQVVTNSLLVAGVTRRSDRLIRDIAREVQDFRVSTYELTRRAHDMPVTATGRESARNMAVLGKPLSAHLQHMRLRLIETVAQTVVMAATDATTRRIAASQAATRLTAAIGRISTQVQTTLVSPTGSGYLVAIQERRDPDAEQDAA